MARQLALADSDPTLDIELPQRAPRATRPLTDDEEALVRSYSVRTLRETRDPAALALAEAMARTSEIPHIRVSDIDFDRRRVWIHGHEASPGRWGPMTEWGARQLGRRIEVLARRGRMAGDPIIILTERQHSTGTKQVLACQSISAALQRAGISGQPGVKPASVAAWAGARAFTNGVPIGEVARMLGVRTLDHAAKIIDWRWREQRGE